MPACQLFGRVLPAGKTVLVRAEHNEDQYETIHFTQAALGAKPKAGAHTVFVGRGDGQRFAIGTLDASRCTRFSCNLTLAMDVMDLSHNGPSEVHLTGYRVGQMMVGSEDDAAAGVPLRVGDKLGACCAEPGRKADDSGQEDGQHDCQQQPSHPQQQQQQQQQQQLYRSPAFQQQQQQQQQSHYAPTPQQQQQLTAVSPWKRVVRVIRDEDSSEPEALSSGEEEEEEKLKEEKEEEEEEAWTCDHRAAPAPASNRERAVAALEAEAEAETAAEATAGAKRPASQQPAAQTPQPAKKAKAGGEQQHREPATAPAKESKLPSLASLEREEEEEAWFLSSQEMDRKEQEWVRSYRQQQREKEGVGAAVEAKRHYKSWQEEDVYAECAYLRACAHMRKEDKARRRACQEVVSETDEEEWESDEEENEKERQASERARQTVLARWTPEAVAAAGLSREASRRLNAAIAVELRHQRPSGE